MPKFEITDSASGRTLTVEGESAPTQEEAQQLFQHAFAVPELRAAQEPSLAERALTATREALSPLLGETENQKLRREQDALALARDLPAIAEHISQQPGAAKAVARAEGGLPTAIEQGLFTPAPGTPQIPMIPQQEGKLAQAGAGVVNTLSSVVNALPTPGGMVALMGGAPALVVGGAAAPSMVRGGVESAKTLVDDAASVQQKAQAAAGLGLTVLAGAALAKQALPPRAARVLTPDGVADVPEAALPGALREAAAKQLSPEVASDAPANVSPSAPAGLEPPANVPPAGPPPGAKPLGFLESARASPEISPDLKSGLNGYYEPQTNAATLAEATRRIDATGDLQAAKAQVLGSESPDAVTHAMGLELVRKFQVEGKLGDASDLLFDMARKAKSQGQAIQILSTLARGTPEGMVSYAQRLLDRKLTPAELAEVEAGMKRVEAASAPEVKLARQADLLDSLNSKVPAALGEKLRAGQNLSLLLNPKTLIRNVAGNVLMAFGDMGVDTLVPAVDAGVSVFTGKRTVSGPQIVEYFKGLAQPARDAKLGYDQARSEGLSRAASIKEGVNTMASLAKLTSAGAVQITDVGKAYRTVFSAPLLRYLEKGLTVSLGVPDRAFYTARLRASLRNQMKVADAAAPTGEMLDRASLEAARAIYQDPNFVSRRMNEVRRTLNFGEKRQFGLGQAIVPFTQVPGSLLLRGLEYSPVGFVKAAYRLLPERFYGPQGFDQRAFAQDFSRALAGTASLTATGYWLAKLGVITGAPDTDKDVEAVRRSLGVGGYRINVSELKRRMQAMDWSTPSQNPPPAGDLMVSYDWAQPVAFPVALGADFAQRGRANEQAAARGKALPAPGEVINAIISGARTIEEQPMLTGLSGFFTAAANAQRGNGAGVLEAFYNSMLNLPGVYIPSAVRSMQQFMDNRVYETRGTDALETAYRKAAVNVPGLAEALGYKPRSDVLGDLAERYQANGNTAFNVFINPAFVSHVKADPQLRELYRIWQQTGESKQMPRVVDQRITINGSPKVLTAPEIADYQQFVGRITRDGFNQLMRSEGYARADDAQRAKVLGRVVSAATTAAKVMLFGDRPKTIDQFDRALLRVAVSETSRPGRSQ